VQKLRLFGGPASSILLPHVLEPELWRHQAMVGRAMWQHRETAGGLHRSARTWQSQAGPRHVDGFSENRGGFEQEVTAKTQQPAAEDIQQGVVAETQ